MLSLSGERTPNITLELSRQQKVLPALNNQASKAIAWTFVLLFSGATGLMFAGA